LGTLVVIALFCVDMNSLYIIKEWEAASCSVSAACYPKQRARAFDWFSGLLNAVSISLRMERSTFRAGLITRDNVSVKVNAVCYFRVVDANLALSGKCKHQYATSQLAADHARSVLASSNSTRFSPQRERSTANCRSFLIRDTEPWGIKVGKSK